MLSLPSFHWTRQPDPISIGRWGHTCNLVGNRQMMSIGGIVVYPTMPQATIYDGVADPWGQGIGVFDLTELEWKTAYEPNDEAYMTPSIVKDYLTANGRYPASGWQNGVVEGWFTVDGTLDTQLLVTGLGTNLQQPQQRRTALVPELTSAQSPEEP